jgi:hypothetical protein
MKTVFLCHATEDKPMVRSVALGLERYDIKCWLDEAEMKPGDNLLDKIENGIKTTDKFCIFLSPNSVKKTWVKRELQQALIKEFKSKDFIIPILLFECEIPAYIEPKIYVDLRNWDSYGFSLESLAQAILGDIINLPSNFIINGWINDEKLEEERILSLPHSQVAIELKLRFDKWCSRRIGTLRNLSNLTLKQIINYCEVQNHIILNPSFSERGDILYGTKWRVMEKYDNIIHYKDSLRRYIIMMRKIDEQKFNLDILRYFLSFYD